MLTSAQGLIRQAKSAMPASQLKVYILSSVPRDGDDDDGGDAMVIPVFARATVLTLFH